MRLEPAEPRSIVTVPMRDESWTERDPLPMLWRVRRGGGRRHGPAGRAAIANAERAPRGLCLLQYTVSGCLQIRRGRVESQAPRGFAALMWYGERSVYAPSPREAPYESRWLVLDGPGLLDAWGGLIRLSGGLVGPDRGGRLLAQVVFLVDGPPPRPRRERIDHSRLVQRLVADLYQTGVADGPQLDLAVAALTDDAHDCGRVSDIAARYGCSREHLTRRFTAVHGMPPQRWLAARRVAEARRLLDEGSLTARDVARRCGWAGARGMAHALARSAASRGR